MTQASDNILLDACDEALKSADEVIIMQDKQVIMQKENNEELKKQIEELAKINTDLLNQPWYKQYENTFMLGVIGGLVGGFIIGDK